MNASTDFLMTVLSGHYVAAACIILELEKADSSIPGIPDYKKSSLEEKQAFVFRIAVKWLIGVDCWTMLFSLKR